MRILRQEKMLDEAADSKLVNEAVNGNLNGFAKLCQRYYPAMVAMAHAILGDRHLA